MATLRTIGALVVATALTLPIGAQAQATANPRLADGRDWQRSSPEVRRAYLAGVSNMISVGARYDAKHDPGQADTFSQRAQKGLDGFTVDAAIQTVDAWYKAHPDQLDKPVLSVIWVEMAKPRLAE
ncbi:hypothetical protein [Caulobacter sp. 17J65-9]|uniref:hypothetical protein n=1 Tax=Caulobacter sp. 17J65-9 TaxID=2709382 RepID=UPI0013CCFD64|nr:hypothetical protein [Caulobacter sp. 17J65-9]NEX94748.1 hypothetical protein [Caulobacter sp. 17J65-9]